MDIKEVRGRFRGHANSFESSRELVVPPDVCRLLVAAARSRKKPRKPPPMGPRFAAGMPARDRLGTKILSFVPAGESGVLRVWSCAGPIAGRHGNPTRAFSKAHYSRVRRACHPIQGINQQLKGSKGQSRAGPHRPDADRSHTALAVREHLAIRETHAVGAGVTALLRRPVAGRRCGARPTMHGGNEDLGQGACTYCSSSRVGSRQSPDPRDLR